MSDLALIVVSYNSARHLERCLSALVATGREVVVVDSASTDGSAELVRGRFPNVRLLALEANQGYGAAANEGIRATNADLVLVLNADAWPLGDAVGMLARAMDEDTALGAAGPELVGLDGREQVSLVPFPTPWWPGTPAFTSVPGPPRGAAAGRPSFLVGAALLLRRTALDDVGLFDPGFFMFNEDVDLCWRLHESGWRLRVVTGAVFEHVGGASTRERWAPLYVEQVRGHLLLLAKHHDRATAERARRFLRIVLPLRRALSSGEQAAAYREGARWLASLEARELLAGSAGSGGASSRRRG